ncbi:MAG: A/G-specific adenine glycosylase [bacterium]|nr:A/G-specific adenine glycosylase [bacterium]
MPWRNTRDPYKILVSEVMLQQTQVSRVTPKYKEFLKTFSTVQALSETNDKKLLKVWQGLGYWRRAKNLKETAKEIIKNYEGKLPKDIKTLESLPGIGPYTARALACFAFGSEEPFIDTNIRRLYIHFFFSRKTASETSIVLRGPRAAARGPNVPNQKNVHDKEILKIAKQAVWKKNPREWHYALFDYGAKEIPKETNKKSRHYTRQTPFKNSFRFFRTKVVRALLEKPKNRASREEIGRMLSRELKRSEATYSTKEIIASLLKDKLLKKTKNHYSL